MQPIRDMERQKMLVAVDAVVFTVIKGKLSILLIQRKNEPFKGKYAFPGGFVRNEESLEDAAARELYEETGVKDIFLKRFTAYGDVDRDPRGRIITVVFLALIDAEKFHLEAKTDAMAAEWVPLNKATPLAFDHEEILREVLEELRYEIQITNIAAQLLPEKFTLSELQQVYEIVLGMKVDKRNFRKRIKALDILHPLRETRMEGAHRPAQLYTFKDKHYKPLKERIQVFV